MKVRRWLLDESIANVLNHVLVGRDVDVAKVVKGISPHQ